MCMYCKAASTVLDLLWEDPEVRDTFHTLGADLAELGPLTHEVFVPAYCKFKNGLDATALSMLDAQLAQDLLEPHYDKKTFREAWDAWGESTRADFLREQSEVMLARLLMSFYTDDFLQVYKAAYKTYLSSQQART